MVVDKQLSSFSIRFSIAKNYIELFHTCLVGCFGCLVLGFFLNIYTVFLLYYLGKIITLDSSYIHLYVLL